MLFYCLQGVALTMIIRRDKKVTYSLDFIKKAGSRNASGLDFGSDDVVGLGVLVDQGILLLDLVEDSDLSLDVLGLDVDFSAVDQSLVPCVVETVGAHGELVPHISLQSDFFFVPD